jgi:hypothetical protein
MATGSRAAAVVGGGGGGGGSSSGTGTEVARFSLEDIELGHSMSMFAMNDRTAPADATSITIAFVPTPITSPALLVNVSGTDVVRETILKLASSQLARSSVCAVVRAECTCPGASVCDCDTTRDDARTTLVRAHGARLLELGVIEADLSDVTIHDAAFEWCVEGTNVIVGLLPVAQPPTGSTMAPSPLLPPRVPMSGRGDTAGDNLALVTILPFPAGIGYSASPSRTNHALATAVAVRRSRTKGAASAHMVAVARPQWVNGPGSAKKILDFFRDMKTGFEPQRFVFPRESIFWRLIYDETYRPAFTKHMNFEAAPVLPYYEADYMKQVILTAEAVDLFAKIRDDLGRLLPFRDLSAGIRVLVLPNSISGAKGTITVVLHLELGVGGVRLTPLAASQRATRAAITAEAASVTTGVPVTSGSGPTEATAAPRASFKFTVFSTLYEIETIVMAGRTTWEEIFQQLYLRNMTAFKGYGFADHLKFGALPQYDDKVRRGGDTYKASDGLQFTLIVT